MSSRTMRLFGPILPGREIFVRAFLDWQHEQERPGPTKLRRVAPESDTDQGFDQRPPADVNVDELRGETERGSDPA